eukprot:7377402-Prymnesium_polylepis.1
MPVIEGAGVTHVTCLCQWPEFTAAPGATSSELAPYRPVGCEARPNAVVRLGVMLPRDTAQCRGRLVLDSTRRCARSTTRLTACTMTCCLIRSCALRIMIQSATQPPAS